jgi:hypothetical protein
MLASAAHATGSGGLNCGSQLEFGESCTTTSTDGTDGVNKIVNLVITIFSWLVGVVSVVMIIVGGFKYVTSGGESAGVTSAKNTILYAIVGLIIVAVAQIIVHFVLGNVNSAAGTS